MGAMARHVAAWAGVVAAVGVAACGDGGGDDASTRGVPFVDETSDQIVVRRDVTYGRAPTSVAPRLAAKLGRPELAVDRNRPLRVDLYRPDAPGGARPAVVVVHGGGFGFGDKRDAANVELARALAQRGYVAAAINYRLLALKYCYGAKAQGLLPACYRAALGARDDAETAVRWLRAHAGSLRVDPGRIAIAGESAGGVTAYLVGTDSRGGPAARTRVSAFFSLSGGAPHGRFAGPRSAPGLFAASRGELDFPWSTASARALARAGVPAYLDVIPGSAHAPFAAHRDRLLTETSCFFLGALRLTGGGSGTGQTDCARRLQGLRVPARGG